MTSLAKVAIVGPSHAGKSTLLRLLLRERVQYGLLCPLLVVDLDVHLGPKHRSNHSHAIELIHSQAIRAGELVAFDVGAGQVVREPVRAFLRSADNVATVAVWCDEPTFRARHAPESADREVRNNYSADLVALWEECRAAKRLVNTSSPHTIPECAFQLATILQAVASFRAASGHSE